MGKELQPISKGIVQDLNEEFQPEATYRFMLNGLLESLDGDRGGVVNERGNEIIITLPNDIGDPYLVGHCLLPNQDKVLFLVGNDGWQDIQLIGLHKNDNTFKELIRTNCLEYTKCDQIDCIFKLHNGCDIIIYFTDHKNKYKSINLSDAENTDRYIDSTHVAYTGTPAGTNPNIPTVDPGIGIGDYGWRCNAFYLSPVSSHPNIFFHSMGSNGDLRVGTYTFFIRLLDDDLNPTDWLTWSNPITVKQGLFSFISPPDNTDGFYNDVNIENFVSKSINLIINNLDTTFKYYEVGILERSLNTNLPSFSYRSGQILIPSSGNDIYQLLDVNNTSLEEIPVSSLLTRTRKIDVVQAHTQINNRLILGNLTSSTKDWYKFQQKANDIKVEYFTYNTVDINEPTCGSKVHFVCTGQKALDYEITYNGLLSTAEGVNYSSPDFLSYGMSLMRDEVYALGIIYVFKDGSESPVFHIPGRPKFSTTTNPNGTVVDTYTIDGFDYANYANFTIRSLSNPTLDVLNGATVLAGNLLDWDTQTLTTGTPHTRLESWESNRLTNLPQDNVLANVQTDEYKYLFGFKDHVSCCYSIPFGNTSCSTGSTLERWQYYNTAIKRKDTQSWFDIDTVSSESGDNPVYTFSGGFKGLPGYFDTGVSYPDILDCDGNRIFPEGNVRHHRMPDHRIEQLFDKQGHLGLNEVTGTGLTTNAAWLATSNIDPFGGPGFSKNDLYATTGIDGNNWTMNDSESVLKLYPIGLNLHDVNPPEEYREDVIGYYIVRSDRSNNKTVIDKGFMNVCDTSVSWANYDGIPTATGVKATDDFNSLNDNNIYTNDLFLTPNHKPGLGAFGGLGNPGDKVPTFAWWNIMEIHTPKSTMNEAVNLSADYIKLESTVFGDMFYDSNKGEPTTSDPLAYIQKFPAAGPSTGWNGGMSVFLNRHKYPRVQSPINRITWSFIYNIPISGMAYVGFNSLSSTNALGKGSTTINNSEYQQRTLVARYNQSCTPVAPTQPAGVIDANTVLNLTSPNRSVCDLNFPFHYEQLKQDILYGGGAAEKMYLTTPGLRLLDELITTSNQVINDYAEYRAWSRYENVTDHYKWAIPYSPYMYYVALKSSATPYEDFDNISYIKMHSYLIPSSQTPSADQSFAVTGGDTFINRFQFEKGYYDIENTAITGTGNSEVKFLTTLTAGYVESEINSPFRHLLEGDLYRSFPFSARNEYYGFLSTANEIGGTTRDELDAHMDKQNIQNRYKIDYSSYNQEVVSVDLPTTFDYCSDCSESFPNTLVYSEISLDSQIQDFYKLFLINSFKNIPNSTGSIQDLFVKNSDLYIHTEHNLWKISVAPQQLNTNADVVEVGQGEFLDRDPVKLFNNENAFSRGGIIDKFTTVYGEGQYIWLDRNSKRIYSFSDGFIPLSDQGLYKWFDRNLEVNLDTQFKLLTSKPYPFKGTSCELNVGYKAVYDNEHKRYILTKKDYKLLPSITSSMIELTTNAAGDTFVPATVIGQYYYDDDGFYVGIAVGTSVALKDTLVESIDYTDKDIAENKSWTISYSLKDKAWSSWHSYIPNWSYYDSTTFYTYLANSYLGINNSIWMHNYGDFQKYYGVKFDFIIDYIYKKNPFQEKTFDTIEYTSNVWLEELNDERWIEIPFTTFDRFYVYNNNQISNLKILNISNQDPYSSITYNVNQATAHKWRNSWKINRLRDMSVDRLSLDDPTFSKDWNNISYQNAFNPSNLKQGYIDHIINPDIIDLNKDVYQIERFTDKYLGVRLFFNNEENYKLTLNITTGEKRNKI